MVSYTIKDTMDVGLVLNTVKKAIEKHKGHLEGLILHSDQGAQYTSYAYQKICIDNGIKLSMNAPGTPGDNAAMESFYSNLKRETLYSNYYYTIQKYMKDVIEWIGFYNTKRIQLKTI